MTKLEKIQKKLSDTVIDELDSLDSGALKTAISNGLGAVEEAKVQLEASPDYQEAKQNLTDLSAGYRDLKSYQGAKISYAMLRLRELGEGKELEHDIESELAGIRAAIKGRRPAKKAS